MTPYSATSRLSRPSASQWASQLSNFFQRVAVFALNGTAAEVVAVHGVQHQALGVSISLLDRTPLRWAIDAGSPLVGAGRSPGGASVAYALGLDTPRAFAVVPLAMPGGIVGLAYADGGVTPFSLAQVSAALLHCQAALGNSGAPIVSRRAHLGPRRPRSARPVSLRRGGSETLSALAVEVPLEPQVMADSAMYAAGDQARAAFVDAIANDLPMALVEPQIAVAGESDAVAGFVANEDASIFTSLVQAAMVQLAPETASDEFSAAQIDASLPFTLPLDRPIELATVMANPTPVVSMDADYDLPFVDDDAVLIDESEDTRWTAHGTFFAPVDTELSLSSELPMATNQEGEAQLLGEEPVATSVAEVDYSLVTRREERRSMLRAVVTSVGAMAAAAAVILFLLSPATRDSSVPKRVTVPARAHVATVAAQLQRDGVIRSAIGFTWLARWSGADRAMRAGTYQLSPNAWAWEQLRSLCGKQSAPVEQPQGRVLAALPTHN